MAEDNAFTRILNKLDTADTAVTEKTASEGVEKSTEATLLDTVRAVSDRTTKTASEASAPAAALEDMAKEAHVAEVERQEKLAQHYGAAVADGFMARFAQYDSALEGSGVKTAAPSVDVDAVKQAAYTQAVTDLNKQAEDEYQRGYADQLNAIHKVASDIHLAGQASAQNVLDAYRANS